MRFHEQVSIFVIDLHKSRWSTAIPALLGNRLLINMKEKAEPFPMTAFSDELTTVEVSHGTYVN